MANTINTVYNNTIWALSNHSKDLQILQEQASTGKRVNRPSDAVADSNRILELRSEEREITNNIRTISEISSRLEMSSSVIQSITSQVADVRSRITMLLSGIQAGDTAEATKLAIASEMNDILEQMVSMANTERAGQSLFGGSDSSSDAYEVTRDDKGRIANVSYAGSYDERAVRVASGVEMSSMLVGDKIFRTDVRKEPELLGETGIAAGTGTSTVRGTVWVQVTEPTPGVFRLAFDGDATNFVEVPPTSVNTKLTNSQTGEVLYLDTTNVSATGLEVVNNEGTYDIFNSLISLRDVLLNENGLSDEDVNALVSKTAEDLEIVNQNITGAFTYIGGRIEALENLKNSLEDTDIAIKEEKSRMQDADIAEVSVDLAEKMQLYEMSLSVASRLFSLSILDYLR